MVLNALKLIAKLENFPIKNIINFPSLLPKRSLQQGGMDFIIVSRWNNTFAAVTPCMNNFLFNVIPVIILSGRIF